MKRLIYAAATTLAVGCTANEQKPQFGSRPNILFIIAEDMTVDLGCYGRTDVKTPNLDRLASEGVMFTNARCVAPISSPTRSAMLTGLHHEITASHNHRSHRDLPLADTTIVPFTKYLRESGYTCVLGNRDCFYNVNNTTNDQENSKKIDCNFKYENVGSYDGVEHFGIFDKEYDVDPADMPFFNQVTLYVTHRGDWWKSIREQSAHPVNPDEVVLPPYLADHPRVREEFACYLDQVEHMDAEVGMLMDQLKEKDLLDNTIIFFIADNGRADLRAKGFLYEDGTHIPMIVWGKGIRHAVCDDLVSELDLPASFLHLAGVPIPDYYQGHVLDVLNPQEAEASGAHDWVYTARDTWDEVPECIRGINDDTYAYIRNYRPDMPYAADHIYMDFYRPALHVMRRLKAEGALNEAQLLYFADSKPLEELYNYREDPFCLHNLAADPAYSGVLESLRAKMDEWQSNYTDAGVEDHLCREVTENRKEENRPRWWGRNKHPEVWAEIEDGAICDIYDLWKKEMKAANSRK